jgi:hypothetical protein
MNIITATDLHDLVDVDGERCVSIYMPTHPTGREGQQDSVRLKNLIRRAEEQLIKEGMRCVEARDMLNPVSELPRQIEWIRRDKGLAIFRSTNRLDCYWLKEPFEELLVVGRRFYIKPLLFAVSPNVQFFVLAISRNQVRVLKGTSHGWKKLDIPDLPTSMAEGLNLQTADRGEQVHSGMRGDFGKEAAAGNQSPRYVVRDHSISEARRLGELLGAQIQRALSSASFARQIGLFSESTVIELPPRQMPSIEIALTALRAAQEKFAELQKSSASFPAIRSAECAIFGAEETLALAQAADTGALDSTCESCLPAEIQVIGVAEQVFVGWPGKCLWNLR